MEAEMALKLSWSSPRFGLSSHDGVSRTTPAVKDEGITRCKSYRVVKDHNVPKMPKIISLFTTFKLYVEVLQFPIQWIRSWIRIYY